jgi:hypothetical protein
MSDLINNISNQATAKFKLGHSGSKQAAPSMRVLAPYACPDPKEAAHSAALLPDYAALFTQERGVSIDLASKS